MDEDLKLYIPLGVKPEAEAVRQNQAYFDTLFEKENL